MSRPQDQLQRLPAAGALDNEAGEFWIENPWFGGLDHNLSAFEENRILLNRGDGTFVEATHLAGAANLDSDSRGVVAADFDGDGDQDLVIRSTGGGPVRIFRNLSADENTNWLQLRLKGARSNPAGIGARIRVQTGDGQSYWREVQANNSNSGQNAPLAHFQLPSSPAELIEVHWPSGLVERHDAETRPLKGPMTLSEGSLQKRD